MTLQKFGAPARVEVVGQEPFTPGPEEEESGDYLYDGDYLDPIFEDEEGLDKEDD